MSDTAGGFLPSPPSSVASAPARGILPTTRSAPLRAGSKKESTFIRYFDTHIGNIRRKLAKRYEGEDTEGVVEVDDHGTVIKSLPEQARIPDEERWGHGRGYASFRQAAADVWHVFDLVWATAAPGIQIPYTITLASIVNEMIPAFPPQTQHLFRLLRLLDHAFASLILQKDVDTGRLLPGFGMGGRAKLTDTEKVRINSLVNRARTAVAKKLGQEAPVNEATSDIAQLPQAEPRSEVEMDADGDWVVVRDDVSTATSSVAIDQEADAEDDIEVKLSRVYDKTLMELGGFTFSADFGPRTE